MILSIIAAVARDGTIGDRGRVPWDLPEDRAHFRRTTWGHPILVGRRTFETLGGPLPGRATVVLSRTAGFVAAGCRVARSLQEALEPYLRTAGEVFVAGGGVLYAEVLPSAHRLYITEVEARPGGDVRFPDFDREPFTRVPAAEPFAGFPPSRLVLYFRSGP